MKKIAVGAMMLGMMAFATPVLAANIADISANYWAATEINAVVDDGVLTLDGGNFNPEVTVSRVDFVQALLKVLTNDNLNVKIKNSFSDISESDSFYSDVLRSEQLGLVYGYPNGTFQPARLMTRSETQSVISHITKDMNADKSVLSKFTDENSIPGWARGPWAKTLNYGIYVNYPSVSELRPNDVLTRAEEAVILYRLKQKLSLVKDEYKGSALLGIEHLNAVKNSPNNEVKVYADSNTVQEGNVIVVNFDEKFKSDKAQAGDAVYFVADKNIATDEGTVIFPEGTKFNATVLNIQDPKWFNKNARAFLEIKSATLPDGTVVDLSAKPFYKNYELKEGPWMTAGKLALYTVTGGAVGTGAGIGFGFIPDPTRLGTGVAIGAPVGAAVGLATGLITKGLNYHAKVGEKVNVIMLKDASVKRVNSL